MKLYFIYLVTLLVCCVSNKKKNLREELDSADKDFQESKKHLDISMKKYQSLQQKKDIKETLKTIKQVAGSTSAIESANKDLVEFTKLFNLVIYIDSCYDKVNNNIWEIKIDKNDSYLLWDFSSKLGERFDEINDKTRNSHKELYNESKKVWEILDKTIQKKSEYFSIARDYNLELNSFNKNRPRKSQKFLDLVYIYN